MPNGQKINSKKLREINSAYVAEKVFSSPFSRAITRLLIFSASSDDEVEGGTKKALLLPLLRRRESLCLIDGKRLEKGEEEEGEGFGRRRRGRPLRLTRLNEKF